MNAQKMWYFIDIDGCVMPSLFSNQFYNTNEEKLQMIIEAYKKANANILFNYDWKLNTILYSNFVEFYKEISKKDPIITFITGRQENTFGWLTLWQLESLTKIHEYYGILYFPNDLTHSKETYKDFKIKRIRNIVSNILFDGTVKIYDDNDYYFQDLKDSLNVFLDLKCNCYLAKSDNDWKVILEELQKEVK